MDHAVRDVLQSRLGEVEQEIVDLGCLLRIMRRIERDAVLRERLRNAELGFRMQDLWSGRLTGDGLRSALATLEGLTARVA